MKARTSSFPLYTTALIDDAQRENSSSQYESAGRVVIIKNGRLISLAKDDIKSTVFRIRS